MTINVTYEGNLILNKLLKVSPLISDKIAYYVGKNVAEKTREEFPIKITGLAAASVWVAEKDGIYYLGMKLGLIPKFFREMHGISNKMARAKGVPRRYHDWTWYPELLEHKYGWFTTMSNRVTEAYIKAVGDGLLKTIIKNFEDKATTEKKDVGK